MELLDLFAVGSQVGIERNVVADYFEVLVREVKNEKW